MKRVLLATSAIAGLALASPVSAQEAPIVVTLGGQVEFQSGFFSSDDRYNITGRSFRMNPEIQVNADAVADNGLEYGAEIQIEASGRNFRMDEDWLYVSGNFGEIRLGDDDGAADNAVFAPTVGIGQLDGSLGDFTGGNAGTSTDLQQLVGAGTAASPFTQAVLGINTIKVSSTADSTKIVYLTPEFAGIQGGVSYTPELNEGDQVQTGQSGSRTDTIEAYLQYNGEFNGVGVSAGFTMDYADVWGDFTQQDLIAGRNAFNLRRFYQTTANATTYNPSAFAWQLGGQISYAGFAFGGGYLRRDFDDITIFNEATLANVTDTASTDAHVSAWNIGASYTFGPAAVAINYAQAEFDNYGVAFVDTAGAVYDNEYDEDTLAVGFSYTVAPGLRVAADYYWVDVEGPSIPAVDANGIATGAAANDPDSTHVFVTSVRVSF